MTYIFLIIRNDSSGKIIMRFLPEIGHCTMSVSHGLLGLNLDYESIKSFIYYIECSYKKMKNEIASMLSQFNSSKILRLFIY